MSDFWAYVDQRGPDECWPWRGQTGGGGYGRYQVGRRRVAAHRVAYELLREPIPAGLVIDHLCRNRTCVNVAHMEAVDNRTNVLRGVGPTARHARTTVCPHGHRYEGDNLVVVAGFRVCLTCRTERKRAVRRARRISDTGDTPKEPLPQSLSTDNGSANGAS